MSDVDPKILLSRLMPYYADKRREAQDNQIRFVHYTSAEAAMSIADNRTVWLRNARLMNDFSEIEYGLERLFTTYRGALGDRLRRCVDLVAEGLVDEIGDLLFRRWNPSSVDHTYLMSLSEHAGPQAEHEDVHGRLSMWRAYGGRASVALVMNSAPFLAECDVITAVTSPVLYADQERFNIEFERIVSGLEKLSPHLPSFGREALHDGLFFAFHCAILSTKHPGFCEEREWRIIYSAKIYPCENIDRNRSVRSVRGVPQIVHELPLRDIPDDGERRGLYGAEIPALLDRVIIGPSEDGRIVQEAVIDILKCLEVQDAANKVVVSGIPLRN